MLRVLQKNTKMSKQQSSQLKSFDISDMFKFLLASSCPNWSTESQYTSLSESLVRWLGADAATLGSNVITKREKREHKTQDLFSITMTSLHCNYQNDKEEVH